MKKTILFLSAIASLATLASSAAMADGFVCKSEDGLTIKMFNHVQPAAGTRNGAVMILSDDSIQYGRKTIARFTDVKGTLSNSGAFYGANVDLRFNDSSRKGELVLGTKLGELDRVYVDVAFSYGAPVSAQELLVGTVTATKRNGEILEQSLECSRYLKN
jgi:hypothetical protein